MARSAGIPGFTANTFMLGLLGAMVAVLIEPLVMRAVAGLGFSKAA